jgi:hypothetical protein
MEPSSMNMNDMVIIADPAQSTAPRLDPLTSRALEIVTGNLTRFGNELSEAHAGELRALLLGMSELARGKRKGRFAYALDCGLGKTQAVVALCAAIHQSTSSRRPTCQ